MQPFDSHGSSGDSNAPPIIAPPILTPPIVASEKQELDPNVCANCDAPAETGNGYTLPLCTSCREGLARMSFPPWVNILIGLVGVAFFFSVIRAPATFSAAIAFERGKQAEAHGQPAEAAKYYHRVVQRYPDSTKAMVREAIALLHARQYPQAVPLLKKLEGRELGKEDYAELGASVQQAKQEVHALRKQGAVPSQNEDGKE